MSKSGNASIVGEGDKREKVVDHREEDFFEWEHHLLDAHLLEKGRRVDDGKHAGVGGVGHEREQRHAQDEVDGIVLDIKTEHGGEDERKDRHHKKRVENAPNHTQHGATILELEVARHELLEDENRALANLLASLGVDRDA